MAVAHALLRAASALLPTLAWPDNCVERSLDTARRSACATAESGEVVVNEVRVGLGWDSHRLAPGRALILGGVAIPSEFGLDGHSDADILSHAIVDALLGAAALGDIGMHFPDTDPRWKGASSNQFLAHAVTLVRESGYHVANVDSTVILERPKLKDYRMAIRESLAATLELGVDRVSVKFKTAERVGPVGEGKSGEAQAIVTLRRHP
jgi:2-C-methyl-D-erythritol 2,4-cyclodiphosphate synthase